MTDLRQLASSTSPSLAATSLPEALHLHYLILHWDVCYYDYAHLTNEAIEAQRG